MRIRFIARGPAKVEYYDEGRGNPTLVIIFNKACMIRSLWHWLKSRHPKPFDQLLAVEFDETEVRVRVLQRLETGWNQTFEWSNIKRVCFKDGGLWSSDIVYISLINPDVVKTVPTEARGGSQFFGALCDRGLFPEHVWRRAIGDTNGGMHCWPQESN